MSKYYGIHTNNKGQAYDVFDVYTINDGMRKKSYQIVRARFLESGGEVQFEACNVSRGTIKDPLSPSVSGIGMIGYASNVEKLKAYSIWAGMLGRCYDKSSISYAGYGAKGVMVDKRWHRFDYFLEDLPKIDGYQKEKFEQGLLVLDKDKKQLSLPHEKRVYSLKTCSLISAEENSQHRDYNGRKKTFDAVAPDGRTYEVSGLRGFAREHKLNHAGIIRCLKGTCSQHKGWTFSY